MVFVRVPLIVMFLINHKTSLLDVKVGFTLFFVFLLPGNAGQEMLMCSNMFHFQPISECHIYQYHVDFSPDVPSKRLRMSMINSQAEVLGPIRITDGMLLFLPNPLPTEVWHSSVTAGRSVGRTVFDRHMYKFG